MNVTEKMKITTQGQVFSEFMKFNNKTNEVYMQMRMRE